MQEIIIYRNPAEAAIWNMLLSDVGFALIVWLIVFLVSFVSFNKIINEIIRKQRMWFRRFPVIYRMFGHGYVSIAFGLVVASFCSWFLFR